MSDFAPGFVSRHDAAATALARVFGPAEGFVPVSSIAAEERPVRAPRGFAPEPVGPRHFSPADRDANPTEGWDVFDGEARAPDTGFSDPVADAHDAGYVEGYDAARAEAAAEQARERTFCDRLGEALAGAARVDRERLAANLRATVLQLTRQLVGEIGVSGVRLEQRIASAVDLIADSAEAAILHLHPDDLALVDGALPSSVFAAADAAIERGSFRIESATTIVEDGPELWFEQLTHAIDHAPLPPAC